MEQNVCSSSIKIWIIWLKLKQFQYFLLGITRVKHERLYINDVHSSFSNLSTVFVTVSCVPQFYLLFLSIVRLTTAN